MKDTVTILSSRGPLLTKRWTAAGIEPYDRAKMFTVEEVQVESIAGLAGVLQEIEGNPCACVIRGRRSQGSISDSNDALQRTLENFDEVPRRWVCLDIDSFEPALYDPVTEPAGAVEEFITTHLPDEFQGVSCHWQLSSSAGAPGNAAKLKAHIWYWLDRPVSGAQLEAWGRSVSPLIDLTVFRTVQVHYTAAPVIDAGVTCPVATRSGFIEGVLGDEVALVLPEGGFELPERVGAGRTMVDPSSKRGVIGAFCRVYDPLRAIEELIPEHFELESEDNDVRLTWLGGSGAVGGACVTDDGQHVYNSHSTDPLEGRAVNTWDLVRHYKFGHLDANLSDFELDDPKLWPSQRAMRELARSLPDVQAELLSQATDPPPAARVDELEPPPARAPAAPSPAEKATPAAPALDEAEEVMQRLLRSIDRCVDATDLERRSGVLRDVELTQLERERIAKAVQKKFKTITGTLPPIATVRRLITPARAGSTDAPEWLADWVYVTDDDTYFNTTTKESVGRRGFDALHTLEMPLIEGTQVRESAARWAIDVWGITVVTNRAYAPGLAPVFELMGHQWANTYREDSVPAMADGGEAAIATVEGHFKLLFPDERERGILLSWLAHNVRHPGAKIRWSPYIYGPQGCGKTAILTLMAAVMGEANVRTLAGSTLKSDFNGWAVGHALIGIEEMYQGGHLYDNEEKLKPSIANDTVDVHRKGKDSYSAPNFTNLLMLSNHPDGYPASEGDRRAFFLKCAVNSSSARLLSASGHFVALFKAIHDNVGALRRWLHEMPMHPEFEAAGRAPITATRETVLQLSKSDVEVEVDGYLEGLTFVTNDWLVKKIGARGHDTPKGRAWGKMLERAGFEYLKLMRVEGKVMRVWARSGTGGVTDDLAVRTALVKLNEQYDPLSE